MAYIRWLQIGSVLGVLLLAGCSQNSGGSTGNRNTSAVQLQGEVLSPITAASLGIPDQARFIAGQAIVKYKAKSSAEGVGALQVRSLGSLELVQQPGLQSQSFVQANSAGAKDTLEWIAELRAQSNVEFAEPNYLRHPLAIPNDEFYASKIKPRFDSMNLEAAWNLTTGSASVVVAVLDDGILWRSGDTAATHPDLNCGRILPGYDFVSSPSNGDGNGRDADPYETPGSDHGSHVAGTIAACSNNSIGVSGVDWKAKVLPVRVLGAVGSDADIIDGIRWAAGMPVGGVPTNPTPAKVINMSLGGFGISDAFDQAIADVTNRGSIVVVAAGNDNQDTLLTSPAGNERVITVGAVNALGAKADFSNFGPGVEVMAPGTNIYSTTSGESSTFGYKAFAGTSMASPHVAGVVALMAAVKPDLTWYEAFDYLTKSAQPIAGCTVCGAGMVDAAGAVSRAQKHQAVGGFITPSQRFITTSQNQPVTLHNYGPSSLTFNAQSHPYLNLTPSSGTIPSGGSLEAILHLTPPTTPSIYYSTLAVTDNSQHQANFLTFYQVGSGTRNMGAVKIALCQESGDSAVFIAGDTLSYQNNIYTFNLPIDKLKGSNYYLRTWVDANNDNVTEMMSYRRYVTLDGSSKANVFVLMTNDHWNLTQQGCIAQ